MDEDGIKVALEAAMAALSRQKQSPRLQDLADRYKDDHKHRKSYRVMRIRITHVLGYVKERHGEDATADVLTPTLWSEYRAWRKQFVQPISVNLELDAMKIMLNWARHNGLVKTNPLADVRRERVLTEKETIIPPDLLERVLAHARPILRVMLEVTADSGMRAAEVINLKVDEVDLDHGFIVLPRTRKKGKQPHELFVGARGLASLRAWLAEHPGQFYVFERPETGKPYSYNRVRDWWRDAVADSGIEKVLGRVRIHDLRHTLATTLARSEVNLRVIQKQLGHADIKTTARYLHAVRSDLTAARIRYDAALSKSASNSTSSEKLNDP